MITLHDCIAEWVLLIIGLNVALYFILYLYYIFTDFMFGFNTLMCLPLPNYEYYNIYTVMFVACVFSLALAAVEFEEVNLASLPPPPSPQEPEAVSELSDTPTPAQTTSSMMHLNITGIFKRKVRKKKGAAKVRPDQSRLTQAS